MSNICKRFLVSGKVQGVFYRDSTRKKARELNIQGWVQNLENGDVELIACGAPDAIQSLEDWLWQGPPAAKVTEVKGADLQWQEFFEFQILN
jgi:acylphosphatase